MRRLAGFLALTGPQRRIVAHALAMLPLVAMGLRLAGLRRVQALLANPAVRATGDARDIARLVTAAARHGPWVASCLPTALTLQWLLRRHGIESDLRLGVRKADGSIEAHAWLERAGEPLVPTLGDAAEFSAFDQVIVARAKASA